jgi:hypothetical protein
MTEQIVFNGHEFKDCVRKMRKKQLCERETSAQPFCTEVLSKLMKRRSELALKDGISFHCDCVLLPKDMSLNELASYVQNAMGEAQYMMKIEIKYVDQRFCSGSVVVNCSMDDRLAAWREEAAEEARPGF